MEPVTDNLGGKNHGVLAERQVLEPDGVGVAQASCKALVGLLS
jgi:hypothetical protein